jgi:hypothetical protein
MSRPRNRYRGRPHDRHIELAFEHLFADRLCVIDLDEAFKELCSYYERWTKVINAQAHRDDESRFNRLKQELSLFGYELTPNPSCDEYYPEPFVIVHTPALECGQTIPQPSTLDTAESLLRHLEDRAAGRLNPLPDSGTHAR